MKYLSVLVILLISYCPADAQQFKAEDFTTVRNIRRAQLNDQIWLRLSKTLQVSPSVLFSNSSDK